MSKSIWHRYDEAPKHQDVIMTDTGCWAYRADLFALETKLERTLKALEIIKKEMSNEYMPDFAVISDALKTALEQKDVK